MFHLAKIACQTLQTRVWDNISTTILLYSRVPITQTLVIWHSILSDQLCVRMLHFIKLTLHIAELITLPHRAPSAFYVLSCYRCNAVQLLAWACHERKKEAQNQIPIANLLKKINISFTNLHYIKYFCLWIFFIWFLYLFIFCSEIISNSYKFELIFTLMFFISLLYYLTCSIISLCLGLVWFRCCTVVT